MPFKQITLEKEEDIAVVTLNRPERLNAWTQQMNGELVDAVVRCNDDPEVGAMVFTGAGRGFCAGADIRDNFQARLDGDNERIEHDWVGLVRSSKPMVAAVNGASVGVGATMILPMDVIVASDEAKFGMFFVKMGVVPELASSYFLTARLGFGVASELMLTGKTLSGQEALDIGLVDKVTPDDALLDEACTIAKAMGENPRSALLQIKQLLTQNATETDIRLIQKREGEALEVCYASNEHKEAITAFLEKRPPDFKMARSQD